VVFALVRWVVVDARVCHGRPVFRGTRVLVSDVLEMLGAGMSLEEVLEEYPQLTREMVLEALRLAAEQLRRGWEACHTGFYQMRMSLGV